MNDDFRGGYCILLHDTKIAFQPMIASSPKGELATIIIRFSSFIFH